jgi:hypothetical protein
MVTNPFPEDITSPDRIDVTKRIGEDRRLEQQPGNQFQTLMNQPTGVTEGEKAHLVSPFELAGQQSVLAKGPSYDTLLAQAATTEGTLADLQNQLNTPNLKLKQSHKYLLNNKLADADAHLRAASEKMGAPVLEPTKLSPGMGPINKFLNFIADGVSQVHSAKAHLQALKDKGTAVNPADFLLIQMKMNKAQQELEYSSVVLSKAVEGLKTIMQIQI